MSVARITEITASSPKSFEDAVNVGIQRATRTLRNVQGAWVKDMKIVIDDDQVTEYRVDMKITFILE